MPEDCPSGLLTLTGSAPGEFAGTVAVIVLLFAMRMFVAGTLPKVTTAPVRKFAPEIVTDVPPEVLPLDGESDASTGAGL